MNFLKITVAFFSFSMTLLYGENIPASTPHRITVALGYHIDPCQAPLIYALHRGIFKKYGLDVVLEPSSGGEEASRSVAMKKADIGITKLPNHIVRIGKGMPLRMMGTLVPQTLEVLMMRENIPNVASLKGKNIGYSTSSPAFTLSIIEKILGQAGLTLSDVTLIAFQKGLAQALALGTVDAAFTVTDPYETIFMEEHQVKVITKRYQEFGIPAFPQFIFFTHKDQKTAAFVPLFQAAIGEAVQEMQRNSREGWIVICHAYPELDTKINARVFLRLMTMFEEYPARVNIEGTQKLLDFIAACTHEGEKILEGNLTVGDV